MRKMFRKKSGVEFNSKLFTNETQTLLQRHREPVCWYLYITYQSQSCTPLISSERTLCGRGSRHRGDEPWGGGGELRCGVWDVSQGKAARKSGRQQGVGGSREGGSSQTYKRDGLQQNGGGQVVGNQCVRQKEWKKEIKKVIVNKEPCWRQRNPILRSGCKRSGAAGLPEAAVTVLKEHKHTVPADAHAFQGGVNLHAPSHNVFWQRPTAPSVKPEPGLFKSRWLLVISWTNRRLWFGNDFVEKQNIQKA